LEDNLELLLESVERVDIEIEVTDEKFIKMKSDIHQIASNSKLILSMPIYEGKRFPLDIGKRIVLYFMKKDAGVYSFNGLVVKREIADNIPVIHIQRISPVKKQQRRDFYRLPVVTDAKLMIPDGIIKEKRIFKGKIEEFEEIKYKELKIVTKDISGGGLRAIVNEKFDTGTCVNVVLELNGKEIKVESEIVRCIKLEDSILQYDLGLRFTETNEKAKANIVAFIFEKQRKLRKKGLV